jgi:hypothetical protein
MSQKPLPKASDRVYSAGECCAIDIKHWTVPDFSGHTLSLHAIDLGSGHSETYLLTGQSNLIDFIAIIHRNWLAAGFLMDEMRVDDQFVTEHITDYLTLHKIKLSQPTPYEHGQNGDIEVLIKHSQETVVKLLDSAQLAPEYWSLALLHATDIRELLPYSSQPSVPRCVLWGQPKASLRITPILPFGTRVLAHLPLKLQTALSGRWFPAIYVGRAPGVKGAIKLFNPSSKRIILRRTFKVLGPVEQTPTTLTPIDIEVSGEEGIDQLFYDPASSTILNPSVTTSGVSHTISGVSVKKPGVSKKKSGVSQYTYRPVLRSELTKAQSVYFSKVGMQFFDTAESEHMKIVDVVLCTSISGAGSKTPYFKFYDIVKFPGSPLSDLDYEYQVCADLLRSTDTRWDDVANKASLIALSAAFAYFDGHRDQFDTLVSSDVAFSANYTDYHSSPFLQANRADSLRATASWDLYTQIHI